MKDENAWRTGTLANTSPKSEAASWISSQYFGNGTEQSFYTAAPPPGFSSIVRNERTRGSEGSSSLPSSDEDGSSLPDTNGILDHIEANAPDLTAAANEFCRQCVLGLPRVNSLDGTTGSSRPTDQEQRVPGRFQRASTSSSSPGITEARLGQHQARIELMHRIHGSQNNYPMEQSRMQGWNPYLGSFSGNTNPMGEQLYQRPFTETYPPLLTTGEGVTTDGKVDLGQYIVPKWSHHYQPEVFKFELQKPGQALYRAHIGQMDRPWTMQHDHDRYHQTSTKTCFEEWPQWADPQSIHPGQRNGPASMSTKLEGEQWMQQHRSFLYERNTGNRIMTKAEIEEYLTWTQQERNRSLFFEPKPEPASHTTTDMDQPSPATRHHPQFLVEPKHVPACIVKMDGDRMDGVWRFQKDFQLDQTFRVLEQQTEDKYLDPSFVSQEDSMRQPTSAVSLNFARNWIQPRRGPQDYVTYTTCPVQRMHREISFYISPKQLDPVLEIGNFAITVAHSERSFVNVRVCKDRCKPRLICTFWAENMGIHEVAVILHDSREQLDGSPFPITVIQDSPSFQEERVPSTSVMPLSVYQKSFSLPGAKFWGVVFNPMSKEIYVADRHSGEVLVFTVQNDEMAFKTKWGLPIEFFLVDSFLPTGIALDTVHQQLFVTDKGNHCVVVFTCEGEYLMHFGKMGYLDGEFSYPWGIAVSPDGEIVAVADSKNHRIQLLTTSGVFIRKYCVFESNPYEFRKLFDQPRGVCFDTTGTRLFVTDFNVAKTFEFDVNLTSKRTFGPPGITVRPQAISLNPSDGSYLICDSRRNRIRQLNSNGELQQTIDQRYKDDFGLEMPVYACFCDNAICIVDRAGVRIQLIE